MLGQKRTHENFSPSIQHFNKFNVHIVGGAEEKTVLFVMHDNLPPYKEINSIEVSKQHFEWGMVIPNTLQSDPKTYTYTAVLCARGGNYLPVKLLRLTHLKDVKQSVRAKQTIESVTPPFPEFDEE